MRLPDAGAPPFKTHAAYFWRMCGTNVQYIYCVCVVILYVCGMRCGVLTMSGARSRGHDVERFGGFSGHPRDLLDAAGATGT